MQVCASCGHQNRPGVLFCENCGTSLTGQPAAGSTKGLADVEPDVVEQVISAGTDYIADGSALRIEIEGGAEPIIVKPKYELIFGRRDPATGAMPDIDLTPYAGYRMGVSRRHAALRATEDHHIDVWDLGSSNGTFLNGVRLNPHRPYRMHDGDHIRLGQMVIRVIFQPPQDAAQEEASDTLTAPDTLAAPESLATELKSGLLLADLANAPETHTGEMLDEAAEAALDKQLTEPIEDVDLPEFQAALKEAVTNAASEAEGEEAPADAPPSSNGADEQPAAESEETATAAAENPDTPAEDAAAEVDAVPADDPAPADSAVPADNAAPTAANDPVPADEPVPAENVVPEDNAAPVDDPEPADEPAADAEAAVETQEPPAAETDPEPAPDTSTEPDDMVTE